MDAIERERILSKAKIALLNKANATFVSTLVLSLKHSWGDEILNPDGSVFKNKTACTDGVNLVLNEDWFCALNPLEMVGLLAHEAYHVALQHVLPDRVKKRDFGVFNQAADHVINLMLLDNKFRLPKGGLHDPRFVGMSTEQVYDILIKDKSLQDPNFVPDFQAGPGNADPVAQAQHQSAVADNLVRAAIQSKMAGDIGTVPGDILIGMDKLLHPKLPWHMILHDFFNGLAADDYTYSKANRRFMPDFFLPSLYSEGMGTFAVAIDTSGSVSDSDFVAFATEINQAKEDMNPEKMFIIDFDTQVNSVYEIGEGDDVTKLKFKGRGGTNLQPVFDHFEKKPPHVLVVFSDLECNEIAHAPAYPVIWIKTPGHGHTPSFGKLIEFDPN